MYILCEKSVTALFSPRNIVLVSNELLLDLLLACFQLPSIHLSTYKNKSLCNLKGFMHNIVKPITVVMVVSLENLMSIIPKFSKPES